MYLSYSAMQTGAMSFCGDFVSDSFIKTFWDEDIILQLNYKKQICSYYCYDDSYEHYIKMHTNTTVTVKPNFTSSLNCAVFL